MPEATEGPDWSKDPGISSVGQCIASCTDPAFMLASACQAGPAQKLQECAFQATPFRVLGLLGEHFALQDDAPATQTTAEFVAASRLFLMSLGCPDLPEQP